MRATADLGSPSTGRARRRRRSLDQRALRAVAFAVLAASGLALLTILTFAYLPRYEPAGRSILDNADFREGFRGWEAEGLATLDEAELGHAILQNHNRERTAYLHRRVALPPGPNNLRLSAEIATSGVERGNEPWEAARVYLVQQAPDGTLLWDRPYRLASLIGTSPRQHFVAVFQIPAAIRDVVLGIELPHTTGRMEIANLALALVNEQPLFRLAAALLVAGWSLLAFWVAVGLYRGMRSPTVRAWLLGTFAFLAPGLLMPAPLRAQLIDRLASGFGIDLADPDAFGHAVLFALLALLVRAGRPRDPLLLHLSCWLLLGAVCEVLQLFTPDRDPLVGDWLMAALGAALGLGAAELGLWLQRRFGPAATPRKPWPASDPDARVWP